MQRISSLAYKFSIVLTAFFFAIMVVTILIEVFARNFLHTSFQWSGELAQYSFVWVSFIGASAAYKNREVLGFDILKNKIPLHLKLTVSVLIEAIIICFSLVLIYYGMLKMLSPSIMLQKSTGLKIPLYFPFVAVPLGMTLILIQSIASISNQFMVKETAR